MAIPTDDTARGLVPPTQRTFHGAHIIICDCANDRFGPKLAEALEGLGFGTVLSVKSLDELKRYCNLSAEIIFFNPHCHEAPEAEVVAELAAAGRRHVQLVMISDERRPRGGFARISRRSALQPVPLKELMDSLRGEWERHQPRRMGGPNDGEFDRKYKRY